MLHEHPPSTRNLIFPVSVSGIIPFMCCFIFCSDGKMERWMELKKDRAIRMVLLVMRVIFSNCNISSKVSLCTTATPAFSADDVINSLLRRIMDAICAMSSSCWLVWDGVDVEWRNVSAAWDRVLRVSLLQLDDPTRGVTSGCNLTVEWLAEWSDMVLSGLLWCVFNFFNTRACSSRVNGVSSDNRFCGRIFS